MRRLAIADTASQPELAKAALALAFHGRPRLPESAHERVTVIAAAANYQLRTLIHVPLTGPGDG